MVLSLAAKFLRLCGEDVGSNSAGYYLAKTKSNLSLPCPFLLRAFLLQHLNSPRQAAG